MPSPVPSRDRLRLLVPRPRADGSGVRHWSAGQLLRDETGVAAVLVLLVLAVGIAHPDFLTRSNLTSTAHNAAYVGLMAAGMVFALAMREVDLSVGGVYALGVTVGAVCIRDGWSPWAAAAAVLALSAALGAGNAIVATYVGLPTFIVTLATAMLFRGIGLALADGKQISGMPQQHAFFRIVGGDAGGLPVAVWVLLAATAGLAVLLTRTRFGAQVRAVGSNPDAALFTGLPIVWTRIKAMALSASMAGLASVLALAFFISGDPTIGQGYELSAIAAAIIGGTPLAGGRGSVPGAVIGALILSAVASALVFFNVPINWTTFATGSVILTAVAADSALRRIRGQHDPNSR